MDELGSSALVGLSPLAAVRRRWWLAAAIVVVLVVLGGVVGYSSPPRYGAEARLAVAAGDLPPGAVDGFPLAAAALASNYARYIDDGSAVPGSAGTTLAASPIPDSNVVRVEAISPSPSRAVAAARAGAQSLIRAADRSVAGSGAAILKQYDAAATTWANATVAQQTAQVNLDQLRARNSNVDLIRTANRQLAAATQRTSLAEVRKDSLSQQYQTQVASSSQGSLVLIKSAATTGSDRNSRAQRLALLGLVVGVALAIVVCGLVDRVAVRRRRRRSR